MAEQTRNNMPPVFMKINGNHTFKQMRSENISKIVKELEEIMGVFEKGGVTIAAGGDLFIRPRTRDQLNKLLESTSVLDGSIEVICTLPNSHSSQRIIIRQVPTGDTTEEIKDALIKQGYVVKNVHRFTTTRGREIIPSSTVALEFEGKAPTEILLNGLVFIPEKQLPSPLRCKKCQKLGHTERFCDKQQVCPNCGKNHDDIPNCSLAPHCVNCNGDHASSSPNCPKFLQQRTIARTATKKGISIHEARDQSYSEVVKGNSPTAPDPEMEILKSQVQALQTEMTRLRTEAGKIKSIEKTVENLECTVNHIQNSLHTLENGQNIIENCQELTNSKLDKLTELFTRNFPNVDNVEMDLEMEDSDIQEGSANKKENKSRSSKQSQPTVSPGNSQSLKRLNTGPKNLNRHK